MSGHITTTRLYIQFHGHVAFVVITGVTKIVIQTKRMHINRVQHKIGDNCITKCLLSWTRRILPQPVLAGASTAHAHIPVEAQAVDHSGLSAMRRHQLHPDAISCVNSEHPNADRHEYHCRKQQSNGQHSNRTQFYSSKFRILCVFWWRCAFYSKTKI